VVYGMREKRVSVVPRRDSGCVSGLTQHRIRRRNNFWSNRTSRCTKSGAGLLSLVPSGLLVIGTGTLAACGRYPAPDSAQKQFLE